MRQTESTWEGPNNTKIYHQYWEPETRSKAVVCLVHGLGEHSGRYQHVARYLNEKGYAVMALDLPGHGRSGGQRGHVNSYDEYMQSIDLLLNEAQNIYPGLSRFLYGHSLGGILVLAYSIKRNPELAGVIATSSGLSTALEQQKLKVFISKILGSITPTLSLHSGLDPTMLSRDPDVVRDYQNDSLVHYKATTRMAKSSLEAIYWIYEHAYELKLPLLMMHGTQDELAYFSGSEKLSQMVGGKCTLKLWEGMVHELHNEPEKEDVFTYLIDWLDHHTL